MPVAKNLDEIPLHFIVGMGRSGTTLLLQILNAVPYCLSTPENHFVMTFYGKYAQQTDIDPNELIKDVQNYYWAKYKSKEGLNVWDLNFDLFFDEIRHSPRPITYGYICKKYLLQHHFLGRNNEQVSYIIDKDHDYTRWIPELLQLFPDAKFIVSVRDYRAVINSHRQSPNQRINISAFTALLWRNNNRYVRQKSIEMPDRFLFIKYEDLVVQQAKVIQQLCDFLGMPFCENMLQSHIPMEKWLTQHAQSPDMTARKAKKWGDLARPIYADLKEAWRDRLPADTIALADLICGKEAAYLGYKTIYPTANFWQKGYIYAKNAPQLLYAAFAYLIFAKYYYSLPLLVRILLVKYAGIKK